MTNRITYKGATYCFVSGGTIPYLKDLFDSAHHKDVDFESMIQMVTWLSDQGRIDEAQTLKDMGPHAYDLAVQSYKRKRDLAVLNLKHDRPACNTDKPPAYEYTNDGGTNLQPSGTPFGPPDSKMQG